MKTRNLPFLIVLLSLTARGTSAATIESRPLKLSAAYAEDTQNRLDAQAKEIQQLLGRVEVLEHSLAGLKERVEIIDGLASGPSQTSVPGIVPHAQESESADDIFSEPVDLKKSANVAAEKNSQIPKPLNVDESKEKKLYDAALAALKDNRLEIAEEKFSSFIKDYPKSSMQSNVYFWYGETFFKRNLFDKAAINYLKGYKQYPKGSKAADSLLKLALSLGELKKKAETCTMLAKLDAEFPSRPASSIKRAKDAKIKFGCK